MAIDILHSYASQAMPESMARARSSKLTAPSAASANTSASAVRASNDDVVITETANTISQAVKAASEYDGIDYDKVNAIKKQLEDGTFEFNFERVAQKMIDHETALSLLL